MHPVLMGNTQILILGRHYKCPSVDHYFFFKYNLFFNNRTPNNQHIFMDRSSATHSWLSRPKNGGPLVCHLLYTGIHGRSWIQTPAREIIFIQVFIYIYKPFQGHCNTIYHIFLFLSWLSNGFQIRSIFIQV